MLNLNHVLTIFDVVTNENYTQKKLQCIAITYPQLISIYSKLTVGRCLSYRKVLTSNKCPFKFNVFK